MKTEKIYSAESLISNNKDLYVSIFKLHKML